MESRNVLVVSGAVGALGLGESAARGSIAVGTRGTPSPVSPVDLQSPTSARSADSARSAESAD